MNNYKYEEIAARINAAIEAGDYPVGSKLPAHRALARSMGTTAVTVAKAYQLLSQQSVIESFVGKGSYVLAKRLNKVIQAEASSDALNFSILQPLMTNSLAAINQQLAGQLYGVADASLFNYSDNTGLLAHRLAGAKWCEYYGLKISHPEQLLLTNGAQNAMASLIQLYSNQGDTIAVEALTYPGILAICKHLKRRVIPVEMDGQGMLAESLRQQCLLQKPAMVIVLPSAQNPTGATMSSERRQEIASVVKEQDIWLLEDDIYAFLNTQKLAPISNYVPEKAFYISSLSKSISPGLRCGYIKAPQDQHSILADFIRTTLWLAPPLMFEIATALIDNKQAFKIAAQQRSSAQRRQLLVTQYLPQADILRQSASYSCWLQLPKGVSSQQFTQQAMLKNIVVSNAAYFSSEQAVHAVRLSVMSVAHEAHFIEGLQVIRELLASVSEP